MSDLSRRMLLIGVGAAALVPVLPKVSAPAIAASVARVQEFVAATADLDIDNLFIEGMSRTVAADLFYGDANEPWRFANYEILRTAKPMTARYLQLDLDRREMRGYDDPTTGAVVERQPLVKVA